MKTPPLASRPAPRRSPKASRPPAPRPRRRRRRSWAAPLVPLAVLCLALEIGSVLLWSPKLQVHRVLVEGNRVARAEALLDRLDVPCGTPLIEVSRSVLEKKLLAEPSVARADVETRWPDEVAIRITERIPAWNVKTSSGWVQADAKGVVFKNVFSPTPSLPTLVLARDNPGLGETLPSATLDSSKVCLGWAKSQPAVRLAAIEVDGEGKFSLRTTTGMALKLGAPVLLEKKLATATRMQREKRELFDGATIEYVNLYMWDAPAVRFRSSVAFSG